jgi:ferredoxin
MTGIEHPMFKIYPHIKALHMSGFKDEDILDIEDYRKDWKKATAIGTASCTCRRMQWGSTFFPEGQVCVSYGRGAEYQVERGDGIMRTPEGMLELEDNLVIPHWDMYTASNMTDKQDFVCHCGREVGGCIFGGPMKEGRLKDAFAPSRYQAVVDPTKCKTCRLCVDNCNVHAISLKQYPDGKTHAWVDPDICLDCGSCVVNCPHGAKKLICVRPPEFIVRRDSMPAGRYDAPEHYAKVAEKLEALQPARRKREKEMEDKWCAEHGLDRNPYGIKA